MQAEAPRALLGTPACDVDDQNHPAQQLSRSETRIYNAVSPAPATAQAIAAAAGFPLPLAVHLLLDLTRSGLVEREGLTWRKVTID